MTTQDFWALATLFLGALVFVALCGGFWGGLNRALDATLHFFGTPILAVAIQVARDCDEQDDEVVLVGPGCMFRWPTKSLACTRSGRRLTIRVPRPPDCCGGPVMHDCHYLLFATPLLAEESLQRMALACRGGPGKVATKALAVTEVADAKASVSAKDVVALDD